MNGFELRDVVYSDDRLKLKSVPFVFLTTNAGADSVNTAYKLSAQGYFVKDIEFRKQCIAIKRILDYWAIAKHPDFYQ